MRDPTGKKKTGLVLCNVILIICVVCAAIIYSRTFTKQKNNIKTDTFCNTVEALKQVSQNYLITEKGYVNDWAAYIEAEHMTAEEALEYIRATNTQQDRAAHLIDVEDLSARSTYLRNGNPWVHTYEEMEKLGTAGCMAFLGRLRQMFEDESGKLLVLGKYRVGEQQKTVVSVGTRVQIRQEDGSDKAYLLLRLIPVEYMQKAWVFPTEYQDAEISLVLRDGGYVVQSPSLRSSTFLEFIRAYNFPDDYNQVNELAQRMEEEETGLLEYKDSKGQDCYFYYTVMGDDADLAVMGYVPVTSIESEQADWTVVGLICGTIFALVLLDGAYILSINRKLRKAILEGEKANMAKTQFLSSMSHDIRTPMNAVIGMTEIAKNHLDDPSFVAECLDKVSLSGNHLLTLVNDILDISKVESGKMTLSPSTFSLTEAVRELCAIVRQTAADKDIELTVEMHDLVQDFVVGDTLRLRQILLNLLNNAVKYTENGGHVGFEISEYTVCKQPDSAEEMTGVRFVISDDGMGMSQEFQKTMYHSFSRATDSRINTIQGSGLGLSIVSQMVELMNGTITCDSELGKGTTFVVTLELPVARTKEKAASSFSETESESDEFKGMHVLVAEDNEMNWEIIQIMLEEYGVASERAENGQICLDMLKEKEAKRYDLVLMDVQMPVLDGREATRILRASEDPEIRNIPVVAMTADAFAEDVYACLEAGMDAHISKPIERKRVLEVLQRAKKGILHKGN